MREAGQVNAKALHGRASRPLAPGQFREAARVSFPICISAALRPDLTGCKVGPKAAVRRPESTGHDAGRWTHAATSHSHSLLHDLRGLWGDSSLGKAGMSGHDNLPRSPHGANLASNRAHLVLVSADSMSKRPHVRCDATTQTLACYPREPYRPFGIPSHAGRHSVAHSESLP